MDNSVLTLHCRRKVAQAMALANEQLRAIPESEFEFNLENLLLEEISKGQNAAAAFKLLVGRATTYTYTSTFPRDVFDSLSEEDILQLESTDIYLSKNPNEEKTSFIRIVFHF